MGRIYVRKEVEYLGNKDKFGRIYVKKEVEYLGNKDKFVRIYVRKEVEYLGNKYKWEESMLERKLNTSETRINGKNLCKIGS